MTDTNELKRLMEAATPGPWQLMAGDPLAVDAHAAVYVCKMTGATPVNQLAANAALIVAAVNALPEHLALREENERLKAELDAEQVAHLRTRAKLTETKKALEPFSRMASYWLERDEIHGLNDDDECATEIRFGDLRAARAALSGSKL